MILSLLLCVFLVSNRIIYTFGQNSLPIGLTSSPIANSNIYGYCFEANASFTTCGLKAKNNYVKASNNQRLFFVKYSSAPANFSVTPKLTPSMQVDPNIGWDDYCGREGKDAEVREYAYQIFINTPNVDERKVIVDHVNLIR